MLETERLRALEDRMFKLDNRVQRIERDQAVDKNDRTHMDKRFDKLESKIEWVGKILGAAILAALANFILSGGLAIAQ